MLDRPLFVVDMTLYEFLYILNLINEVINEFPKEERQNQLKKKIFDMFGKIPIDKDKRPRRLTTSKDKMAGNFMITINQLKLLDDIKKFENLFDLYKTNNKKFIKKLKEILLIEGNWIDYINALKLINKRGIFDNKKEFIDLVAKELHIKYPDISAKAHKKQFMYIKRWLEDNKLKLIGEFSEDGIKIYEKNLEY